MNPRILPKRIFIPLVFLILTALGVWIFRSFGPERESGNNTREEAGPHSGDPVLDPLGLTFDSLRKFWEMRQVPPLAQISPLRIYAPPLENACGSRLSARGPWYCPLESRLYLDQDFTFRLESGLDSTKIRAVLSYMIAHQFGHHIQEQIDRGEDQFLQGFPKKSLPQSPEGLQEIQADYYAGISLGQLGPFPLSADQWKGLLDHYLNTGQREILGADSSSLWPEDFSAHLLEYRFEALMEGMHVRFPGQSHRMAP